MKIGAELKQSTFVVREPCTIEIKLTADEQILPGDTVEFQFPNSWSLLSGPSFTREFQFTDPVGEHFIGVSAETSGAAFEMQIHERHLPFSGGGCRHGRHMVASLTGAPVPAGTPITVHYANTMAPYVTDVDTVWLRVKGQAPAPPPRLTVTGGPAVQFRLLVPSGVKPGQDFDVLVVALDKYDNRAGDAFESKTVFRNDGTVVAKDFTCEGSARVSTRIESEGVYRFSMDDTTSNAVKVAADQHGPYWGDIHIHTKLSGDAQGSDPYGYARDVAGLDFAGVADHWQSLGDPGYEQLLAWAREADDPGRFVTILADERNPKHMTGHHNRYFIDEDTLNANRVHPAPDSDGTVDEPAEPWQLLDPGKAMLIPHHTGISWGRLQPGKLGSSVDIDAADDGGMRPVMEIYSHHGQSELYNPQHILAYEFNRMRPPEERRSNASTPGPYYAQDYWIKGRRFGVIASSDEHSGQGGRPHGGIAAVRAEELTRHGIFNAIRNRQCYGTTGERILVEFTVNRTPMGSCVRQPEGSSLEIQLRVYGTRLLVRVDILRYRVGVDTAFTPILSVPPRPESMDAAFDITELLTGDCIYYARVLQEPLDWPGMAWTSPVWVEMA